MPFDFFKAKFDRGWRLDLRRRELSNQRILHEVILVGVDDSFGPG